MTEPLSRRADLNHVQVFHGKPCPRSSKCRAEQGSLLIETWNRGKASVDIEWQVSKSRVDDTKDHAGSCYRYGPDVPEPERYPELP